MVNNGIVRLRVKREAGSHWQASWYSQSTSRQDRGLNYGNVTLYLVWPQGNMALLFFPKPISNYSGTTGTSTLGHLY